MFVQMTNERRRRLVCQLDFRLSNGSITYSTLMFVQMTDERRGARTVVNSIFVVQTVVLKLRKYVRTNDKWATRTRGLSSFNSIFVLQTSNNPTMNQLKRACSYHNIIIICESIVENANALLFCWMFHFQTNLLSARCNLRYRAVRSVLSAIRALLLLTTYAACVCPRSHLVSTSVIKWRAFSF